MPEPKLSPLEKKAKPLICMGLATHEIAQLLDTTLTTATNTVSDVLTKTGKKRIVLILEVSAANNWRDDADLRAEYHAAAEFFASLTVSEQRVLTAYHTQWDAYRQTRSSEREREAPTRTSVAQAISMTPGGVSLVLKRITKKRRVQRVNLFDLVRCADMALQYRRVTLAARKAPTTLTGAERNAYPLLCRGDSDAEIAKQLGIGVDSVGHLTSGIFKKTRRCRMELILRQVDLDIASGELTQRDINNAAKRLKSCSTDQLRVFAEYLDMWRAYAQASTRTRAARPSSERVGARLSLHQSTVSWRLRTAAKKMGLEQAEWQKVLRIVYIATRHRTKDD